LQTNTYPFLHIRLSLAESKTFAIQHAALTPVSCSVVLQNPYSKGLPRKISKIADNSLIRAMSSELLSINKEIVEQVASEVRLTEEFEYAPKKKNAKKVNKK
jgi:hypothetical protein